MSKHFLGGSCLANCGNGGHVPKNLYRPVDETDGEVEGDVLRSTYVTQSLSRGYPVEVWSLLNFGLRTKPLDCCSHRFPGMCAYMGLRRFETWVWICCLPYSQGRESTVIRKDCYFQIIQNAAVPHSPSMMNPVEIVTQAMSNNPLPPVVSDASLTLGPDLTIEENPVVFQEGDSMQGSHFCSMSGTYILQWRIPEVRLNFCLFLKIRFRFPDSIPPLLISQSLGQKLKLCIITKCWTRPTSAVPWPRWNLVVVRSVPLPPWHLAPVHLPVLQRTV